jgi:hypothetical protein
MFGAGLVNTTPGEYASIGGAASGRAHTMSGDDPFKRQWSSAPHV